MKRITLALAILFTAAGARAASDNQTVHASATVNSTIQLTKSADLDCGGVTYLTTSCAAGSSYHAAALHLVTNNASGWTLTLTSADIDPAQTSSPYTLTLHGGGTNSHTFTVQISASPETAGGATAGTDIAVSGGTFTGLDTSVPPDTYSADFLATAATNP